MTLTERRIIHVDLDAFFASVEQLDNPLLRGKPIAVGGMPHARGVVATCSYEARTFGVRSAMPSVRAKALCPSLIFVQPRMARYKEISLRVQDIFRQTTPLFEMLSMDEAFLDITSLCSLETNMYAKDFALHLKNRIEKEIGITASAGVGPVRQKMLNTLGFTYIADLRKCSDDTLLTRLGTYGIQLQRLAMGMDARAVETDQPYKSRSLETTFSKDQTDHEALKRHLEAWSHDIWQWMHQRKLYSRTVVLKLRDQHFKTITRSIMRLSFLDSKHSLEAHAKNLLDKTLTPGLSVRLLGLGVSSLQDTSALRQLDLFQTKSNFYPV